MNKPETFRKEVHLTKEVIESLQRKADKDGRSLKSYMERILIDHANPE